MNWDGKVTIVKLTWMNARRVRVKMVACARINLPHSSVNASMGILVRRKIAFWRGKIYGIKFNFTHVILLWLFDSILIHIRTFSPKAPRKFFCKNSTLKWSINVIWYLHLGPPSSWTSSMNEKIEETGKQPKWSEPI